jgi:hypothetical protein
MPMRFLTAWLVLTVVGFSFVSGKQAKYLVADASLASRCLSRTHLCGWSSRHADGTWCFRCRISRASGAAFLRAIATGRARASRMGVDASVVADRRVLLLFPLMLVFARGRAGRPRPRALVRRAGGDCGGFGRRDAAIAPYGDPAPAAAHLAELQTRNIPLAHWANIMRSTTSPGGCASRSRSSIRVSLRHGPRSIRAGR